MREPQDHKALDCGNNVQHIVGTDIFPKWGWAVRRLVRNKWMLTESDAHIKPRMGDVILARVTKVGHHTRITMADTRFSRLYEGDTIVGVVGYRYATDAFHAPTAQMTDLHLLTNAGLCGTVEDRHASAKPPTRLEFLGLLGDGTGSPVNLVDRLFNSRSLFLKNGIPVVLSVGTGMNSGKTTVAARVAQALVRGGHRVAMLKLTGSVSPRDVNEFDATGAVFIRDFSDYGFPSTYRVEEHHLIDLCRTMITDAQDAQPDLIMAELADGVLQQETHTLLQSSFLSQMVTGVLLSATCALSALALIQQLHHLGYAKLAISGKITKAPLFVKELQNCVDIPVFDCFKQAALLANVILAWTECHRHISVIDSFSSVAKPCNERLGEG